MWYRWYILYSAIDTHIEIGMKANPLKSKDNWQSDKLKNKPTK